MTLELNKENLLKGLLQYNYFPRAHDHKEELPPIFSTEKFTPDIASKINTLSYRGDKGYDVLPFRRTRHPNIPRMMGIPHPRAYAKLVQVIADNWDTHVSKVCQSPNSQIQFEVQDDFRIIVHKYDHVAPDGNVENQNVSADFGKAYRVKTDITNFYHSVYSHSLPWALVGHAHAKKHKGPKYKDEWFNKIDYSVTLCQRNETKGIPIGPATSSILSETIMFQVDKALRDQKHQFTRYIDDYTVYVDSEEQANTFLMHLTQELEKYALSLNPKKTTISKMPVLNRENWIVDLDLFFGLEKNEVLNQKGREVRTPIKYRQLKMILDKAVSLSKEYPDGSVMKYAFAGIIEMGVDASDDGSEQYLIDSLFRYSYYFPALIPLIQRVLGRVSILGAVSFELIFALLERSFEQGQSDNIIWCMYYLLQIPAFTYEGLLKRCCDRDDPMVILMGYVYAKKNKLSLAALTTWADEKIKGAQAETLTEYDIDRFWLVFYQLYHDGVVKTPPYKPHSAANGKDPQNNKVFELLKKEGVSFVEFDHADFQR
jgi:hypothetical protein